MEAARQSRPDTVPRSRGLLQRKCACGGNAGPDGECAECRKRKLLQRRPSATSATVTVPPIVHDVLRSPGQPLDGATRAFMEPRFARDFSGVRVHTDAMAAESARAVHALAYTVGRNVVFAPGRFAPSSGEGQRLLAHELTHVLQQDASASSVDLQIDPSASAEREADEMASAVADGSVVRQIPGAPRIVTQSLARALQRGTDRCSGAGAKCAASDQCATPDPGRQGGQSASTVWELEVNIDVERSDWESALRNQELGHTHVRFWESSGREYTYGFYPAAELPNENRRTVPGCVHHADTTHDACIDDAVSYSLTRDQYSAALAFAQRVCREGHTYGVSYTCTTYAEEVVRAAGKTLPSSRSRPTTIFYQEVPAIDNPNTLLENVRAARGSSSSDSGIREWIAAHDLATIGRLPTLEMIRMINRLMNGWVSDEDVDAIDRICRSVTNSAQMTRIRAAINPRILDLSDIGQRTRVRLALARNP